MCFSLFCRLMRRENSLYLSAMMRHLQKSNTVLLASPNQQRREQRVGMKWLPDERQEFSNVPALPYHQIWIYSLFSDSLQKSLADSATGTVPAPSEGFIFEGKLAITAAQ